jgi:trehalose/maltose hydrolase-like predicted phosphorylase
MSWLPMSTLSRRTLAVVVGPGTRDLLPGLYRLIVESLLGLRIEVDKLYIEPCLPDNWTGYTFTYRYRNTHYEVKVETRSELDVKAGMPH